MKPPITRTKIVVPRRRDGLITRSRLVDLFLEMMTNKLILISAPAGYGKTSLMIDLAHQVQIPVCWFSIDAYDRDLYRFMAHFTSALAYAFPGLDEPVESLLSHHDGILDIDYLAPVIVNEIYDRIHEPFLLVLDDYHFVDHVDDIDRFINRFIQDVDDHCHLVLVSRTLPKLPDLPLLVARSQVAGLSFEELAFQPVEIQALLKQNYLVNLPLAAAEQLAEESEGWITGLMLSTQTLWQSMAAQLKVARLSGVGLYEYLAQQVLDQQSPEVRDFLLRTALLDEFNAQYCQTVLGESRSWQELVDTVIHNNLFIQPIGEGGQWFRYHQLFREFLQTVLERENPAIRLDILARLAEVSVQREEWEKAFLTYLELGDLEAGADLVERVYPLMARSGRLKTLADWLDALPQVSLAARPILLAVRGIVLAMLGEVDQGQAYLDQAIVSLRRAGDHDHLGESLVLRAMVYRFKGDYELAMKDADEALELSEEQGSSLDQRAEALRAKGLALSHYGQRAQSMEYLRQALAAFEERSEQHKIAMLHMDLGFVALTAGNYLIALDHNQRSRALWQEMKNTVQQAMLANNIGVLHHLQGELERALLFFEEAVDLAKRSGNRRAEALALAGIAEIYEDLGDLEASQTALGLSRLVANDIGDRFLLFHLTLIEGRIATLQGKIDRAWDLLDRAREDILVTGSNSANAAYQLEIGRIHWLIGEVALALDAFKRAAELYDQNGQQAEAAQAHLYLAVCFQTAGANGRVSEQLELAFTRAGMLDSGYVLIRAGRGLRTQLEMIQAEYPDLRPIRQLLTGVDEYEQRTPALRRRLRGALTLVPPSQPDLVVRAFGDSQVICRGVEVTRSDWKTTLSRDMFFCLLAHPAGLAKESLGLLFWPESSPDQLRMKFKNTIYRLRQAISQEVVVYDQGRYQFNHDLDYSYDVAQFESHLDRSEQAVTPQEKIPAYQEALRLYQGPYLRGVDSTWALIKREHLWQRYINALIDLAELHLSTGDRDQALDRCQEVFGEDPCQERAHRLAMRAYHARGDRAAVIRQYERCREALWLEVQANPSRQTEELFLQLIH